MFVQKSSVEEMTSFRKLDVSFTHGQENQRRLSQVDKSLFAGLAPYLTSAAIESDTGRKLDS